MSEHMSEKEQLMNENADNLSAEITEEALAASLNTDESVNGMHHSPLSGEVRYSRVAEREA